MSKEKPRFTLYLSIAGRPAVPAGTAATLNSAIKQCEQAIATAAEVYARGYGMDPAADVWSVYDERDAVTRWKSTQ